jgi:hypothetical protein
VATAIAGGDLSRRSPSTSAARSAAQGNAEHDGRAATFVRDRSDARGAKSAPTDASAAGRRAGVSGTWKDLTDNVNLLAANLTTQVRNIAEVTTAVARGDLSRRSRST